MMVAEGGPTVGGGGAVGATVLGAADEGARVVVVRGGWVGAVVTMQVPQVRRQNRCRVVGASAQYSRSSSQLTKSSQGLKAGPYSSRHSGLVGTQSEVRAVSALARSPSALKTARGRKPSCE